MTQQRAWLVIVLVVFGFQFAVEAQQVIPKTDYLKSSEEGCRKRCTNDDSDELYPRGTTNWSCFNDCRGKRYKIFLSPGVRPSGNNRAFVLLEPITYEIGDSGKKIEVPIGFVTDYASIPRRLWSLYSPHDQYSRAAIIHDYLYWAQPCTKPQADNIFMIAMKESEVDVVTRNAVYVGVHAAGQPSWQENQKERAQKLPRVVPVDRRDFPPNWSWETYRQYLYLQHVEDPPFPPADYCALGDTDNVPAVAGKARSKPTVLPRLVERISGSIDARKAERGMPDRE
jgi:hypothetical protein